LGGFFVFCFFFFYSQDTSLEFRFSAWEVYL
jgi:hypothetical protein